jgi:hypothetical protein
MAPPYRSNIQHVKAEEAGKAATVRRPDAQLDQNIQYLRDLIDAASLGEALFLRDVTVESAALVGQPVYYNSDTQQFERGLAAVENNPTTNTLVATASSDVMGVVFTKTNSTLADLLVLGTATLDISNAVDGTVAAGRYYLSAGQAGMLQAQRPPVTVSVLHNLGDGRVLVVPDMKDFLEDHIHFQVALNPRPAGFHALPVVGNVHVITSPDTSVNGWLPADNAIFNGKAPDGAHFGYNITALPELDRTWPPIPLEAVQLEISKPGDATDLINQGLQRVPGALVQFDQFGIWWMSDCYDQVPWPTDFSGSSSSSASVSCPISSEMELILSYVRMTFATDKTVVTSLKTDSALLSIEDCDGDAASTGDLHLSLLLNFLLSSEALSGHQVVKGLDADTLQLQLGPVVEGIIAGTDVTITSTAEDTDLGIHQGSVTINADVDPLGRELPIELVRLDDTKERFNGNVMYLAFPADQASGLDLKIKIPPTGLPATPHVKIRIVWYGDAAGTPPVFTMTRINITRPSGSPALPTTTTAVVFDVTAIGAIVANDYFEIESAAIPVVAGDTLFIRMDRAGSDGYSGELGMIRAGAAIQSGA